MNIQVLRSADGKHFEIIQVTGKLLGMRAGKIRTRGKSTGTAYATTTLAKAAAKARVAALKADGYTIATLADIS
jgi:hypothetical protein